MPEKKAETQTAGWLITPGRTDFQIFFKATSRCSIRDKPETPLDERVDSAKPEPTKGEEGYIINPAIIFEGLYSIYQRTYERVKKYFLR